MRRFETGSACVALCLLLAVGPLACGGDVEPADEAAEDQQAVDREMDMALEDRGAEPELRDEPREEAPARQATPRPTPPPQASPAPQPTPPPPPPAAPAGTEPQRVTVTVPAGTRFLVELNEELNTRTNRVGDAFTVRLLEPITEGRTVVAPVETVLRGQVTALQKSGGAGGAAIIKVDFQDILVDGEYYPVQATVVDAETRTEGRSSTGEKAAKIGGGAVAGAILGRVVGGNTKGAVIGAAVGAAAGTAITLVTEDRDAVLPQGSRMTLELDEPLVVTLEG